MLARLTLGHLPLCYETRPAGSSFLAWALVAATLGCGGPGETIVPPKPNWSTSLRAGKQARAIDVTWRSGGAAERAGTEAALVRFIEQHPADPGVTGMRLRVGWLRLEQQRYDEVAAVLAVTRGSATGVDADWVIALSGALERRRGNPQAALDILMQLDQRIVDLSLFPLWCDEAVRAALAASRIASALELMIQWRAYAGDEQQLTTELQVEQLLARIESRKLGLTLDRLSQLARTPVAEAALLQARQWMLESVRRRLGADALARKDAALARRLVATAPTKFQRSELGEKLSAMADHTLPASQMMQATIGLLLEMHDAESSRRSAELVTGAMRALAESESGFPVRLLSEEVSHNSVADAEAGLASLLEDGAAVVVAGITAATAAPAVAMASARSAVVVSLSGVGKQGAESPFLFQVEEASRVTEAQFPAVDQGGPARLRSTDPFCTRGDTATVLAGLQGRPGLLVLTDEGCARRLSAELSREEASPAIWLGPEAAAAAELYPKAFVVQSARWGEAAPSQSVKEWYRRFQRLPYWYEAVGYDVTSLSAEALRQLGAEAATGAEAVSAARSKIASALEGASRELMTSQATGFTKERRLVPSLVVRPRGAVPSGVGP